MDESISAFGKTMGFFCNHLASSCDSLKQSIERRPIPFDSASSTFIQSLSRRITNAGGDLNLLDSMSLGTVSFEELLGHCNEVYKTNQRNLILLEDHLKRHGYVSDIKIDSEDDDPNATPLVSENLIGKTLDEDYLMDEPLNLKSLGISDVCLATLDPSSSSSSSSSFSKVANHETKDGTDSYGKEDESILRMIVVSKDAYENLSLLMKSLASWEDVVAAVEKINVALRKKFQTSRINYLLKDEISSLDLGPKARCYFLLLVRMNRLVVGVTDGLVTYNPL